MNIADLVRDEILANFGGENRDIFFNGKYILHCSPTFKDAFINDVIRKTFNIHVNSEIEKTGADIEIAELVIPYIGSIVFQKDMLQGYRIEKTENQ